MRATQRAVVVAFLLIAAPAFAGIQVTTSNNDFVVTLASAPRGAFNPASSLPFTVEFAYRHDGSTPFQLSHYVWTATAAGLGPLAGVQVSADTVAVICRGRTTPQIFSYGTMAANDQVMFACRYCGNSAADGCIAGDVEATANGTSLGLAPGDTFSTTPTSGTIVHETALGGQVNGTFQELRQWSTLRTKAELATFALCAISPGTSGLAHYWGLVDAFSGSLTAGTTVTDSVGGDDGTSAGVNVGAWTASLFGACAGGPTVTPTPVATATVTLTPTATVTQTGLPTATATPTFTAPPAVTTTATPVPSNIVHVNAGATTCTDATGDGSFGNPFASAYNAMLQNSLVTCGSYVELHGNTNGGRYQVDYASGFGTNNGTQAQWRANCNNRDVANPEGGDHTVLPVFQDCPPSNPIVIENYCASPGNCDTIELDASPKRMNTATWSVCNGGACCGLSAPALPAAAQTFCTTSMNTGSSNYGMLWADPTSHTDAGTRMLWAYEQGLSVGDSLLTSHDGSMLAGYFATVNGGHTIVARMADGLSPATHDMRLATQAGDGGGEPISIYAASGITIRRNPLGGVFALRGGSDGIVVDGGSTNITLDGLTILASGSREYGQCIRVTDGSYVTLKNSECKDSMAEGLAAYGGGNSSGTQMSNIVFDSNYVHDTGHAYEDGGGMTLSANLGMNMIIKNCNDCVVRNNHLANAYRENLDVTTSTAGCGGTCRSDRLLVENNWMENGCHHIQQSLTDDSAATQVPTTFPPTIVVRGDCGCLRLQPQAGTVADAIIRNNVCLGNYDPPHTSSTAGAVGMLVFGAVSHPTFENNAVAEVNGACFDFQHVSGTSATVRNNATDDCALAVSGICGGGGVCNLWWDSNSTAPTLDHNVWWAATSGTQVIKGPSSACTRSTAATCDTTAVVADPLFVSTSDLHLQSTSTLRDAGTNTGCSGTTDIDGEMRPINTTCDIGVDELQAAGATPSPTPTGTPVLTSTPPNPTITPTVVPTATVTATPVATVTPTLTPTPVLTATPLVPTSTPSSTPTATVAPTATGPTPTPTKTTTPTPTVTATPPLSDCGLKMQTLTNALLQSLSLTTAQLCK